jgi:predicted alpha/beta hydrolase
MTAPPLSSSSSSRFARRRWKRSSSPAKSPTEHTSGDAPPGSEPVDKLDLTITATDGYPLGASFFRVPDDRPARGAVLIAPAMGVPQRFYEALAQWLVASGFHVLTFDFRGIGRSRIRPLHEIDATIELWAERDATAALSALAARTGEVPLTWLGHSLGGQIVPFLSNERRAEARLRKVITVATGSGYWRENSPELRRKVWLFWFAAVPLTTPLLGYFPGKRLGMVGDLPRGVITQWRAWCLDREYAVGVEGDRVRALFAAMDTPLTSLSFTDDEMMSAANIASIHSFYTGCARTMVRLAPAEVGAERIGHFGFFRREQRPLWDTHLARELAV